MRSQRPPRSLACFLLVVGMFLSHAARITHTLLVQHVVCEHGDLIHAPESPDVSPNTDAEELREEAVETKGSSERSLEHEHCDARSIVHHPHVFQPLVTTALLLLCVEPPTLREGREVRAVSPIDLAPKASPPRG